MMTSTQQALTASVANQSSRQIRRAARFAPGGSIKIRFGGRMMLMVWRTRGRAAALLCRLLNRSLQRLALGAMSGGMVFGSPSAHAVLISGILGGPIPLAPPVIYSSLALPTGGVVTSGLVRMSNTANLLTVNQTSNQAIVNWGTFNIDAGYKVKFIQPSATASILNRVSAGPISSIQGQLESNGTVWLINPAGVMIGNGATINVAGFVASTLQVSDADFLANRLNFTGGGIAGSVTNSGQITALPGGTVYLVGAKVDNGDVLNISPNATVATPSGKTVMAAGDTVTITLGDTTLPGVKVQVTGSTGSVNNFGQIISKAGSIGLAGALVSNVGTLDVSSVTSRDGRIFLRATDTVRIDSKSAIATGVGGEWLVNAPEIRVETTTSTPAANTSYVPSGLIESALNNGGNVSLVAGSGSNAMLGNVTVVDTITKTAGTDAKFSLAGNNSVLVYAPVTSVSNKLDVSLTANSAGTMQGSVYLAGAALDLAGGALTASGPVILSKATLSNLTMSASDLVSFNGANVLNANISLPNVAITDGALLSGSGKLVAANLNWSGGTIAGNVGDPSYDVTNLTLTGQSTLDGRAFNLLAGGVSNATSATIIFKNNGVLNNAGTLTISDQTQLGYFNSPNAGNSVINNRGTINSTNTPLGISLGYTGNYLGGAYDNANAIAFNNTGTVNVLDGELHIGGGGSHTGSFNVSANGPDKKSILYFGIASATYGTTKTENINAGTTISETSTNGGIAVVNFSDNVYATTNLNTDLTLKDVAITAGTLQGTGKLVATNLKWTGGTIAGAINDPAYDVINLTLGGTNYKALDGRVLNLVAGGASSAARATLSLKNNAVLNNAGTFTLSDGGALSNYYSGENESGVINNSGLINAINSQLASLPFFKIGYYGAVASNSIGSGSYYSKVDFNNTGTVKVQTGTLQLGTPLVINNRGQIDVAAGATLAGNADLSNAQGAKISGSGTIALTAHTLINNGVVAPGTSSRAGALAINGNYTQGSTGQLIAKIGGAAAGQHDELVVSGATRLDGTLTLASLGGYVPASGDALNLISGGYNAQTLGKFAAVMLPDYVSVGYGLFEGAPVRVNYVAGGTNFFNNSAGNLDWGNAANWSGAYVPVSVSDVLIDTGFTVQHAVGNDRIRSLVINANNGLTISGGSLSVSGLSTVAGTLSVGVAAAANLDGGLTGSGALRIDGGKVQLGSASTIATLSMSDGTLAGAGNFAVANSFQQSAGTLQFAGASVDLHQASGDLLLRNLTAAATNLYADTGAISQSSQALTLGALTTRSSSGTRLDNAANQIASLSATNSGTGSIAVASIGALALSSVSNTSGAITLAAGGAITQTGFVSGSSLSTVSSGGTALNGANQVGSFSAYNAGSGDISLRNTTRPDTLTLLDVNNAAGAVNIDNTGAIVTSGTLTAAQGMLSLTAHSPIMINSILTARDGITLTALPSVLGTDTVAINGTLASVAGSIVVSSGTNTTVGSGATLQVPAGAAIALTAIKGAVDVDTGAKFIGAQPAISQSVTPPAAQGVLNSTINSLQKTAAPDSAAPAGPAVMASAAVSSEAAESSEGPAAPPPAASDGGGKASSSTSGDAAKSKSDKPAKSLPVCS